MIYITGDTHSEFSRFNTQNFPEQKEMTRDDYVLIAGDFGGVWDFDYRYAADVPDWMSSHISAYEHGESSREKYWLDWFGKKSFTLCFVDGNHENFERLKKAYPVVDYCGGKAHKLRDNVYHLMRGYVFKLDGKTVFTFGGARSHDISGYQPCDLQE